MQYGLGKMNVMEIKYIESKSEYFQWNDFVQKSPQGSLFSETWYLDILKVKYQVLCVIDEDNSIIAGIVLAKNQINTYSNPMLDKYLGVIFSEKQVCVSQKVVSKQFVVIELLITELEKYKSFDYYFHPNFKNWTPFHWNGFTQQTRYTYRIDLGVDLESIKSKFHTNTKRNIKNAIKNNVRVETKIDFESFYQIINKTFLRQGSKAPFDKKVIQSYIRQLEEKGSFVTFGAYSEDGILLSVCGIAFDKKSSYLLLNGVDVENEVRGANALMISHSIEYFKDRCDLYDFEGSMLPGIEQFYRRFGGDLISYYRIWKDNSFNYFKSTAKKMYKKYRYGK